jgi:hypothetical protein
VKVFEAAGGSGIPSASPGRLFEALLLTGAEGESTILEISLQSASQKKNQNNQYYQA